MTDMISIRTEFAPKRLDPDGENGLVSNKPDLFKEEIFCVLSQQTPSMVCEEALNGGKGLWQWMGIKAPQ
jgi:hypothetical protein